MSHPLRIEFPGAVYHLMNRGAARRQIFLDERDCAIFLETVAETHELWRVDVFAYAVMGNHYLC